MLPCEGMTCRDWNADAAVSGGDNMFNTLNNYYTSLTRVEDSEMEMKRYATAGA